MRLIGYEFQKLFQKKILLLVWWGMVTALLFNFYWQCRENDIYDQTLYTQLSAQYGGMASDTALAELEQFSSALSLLQTDIILRETGMEEGILQMILEEQASAFGMTYQEVKDRYAVYAQDREALNQVLVVLVSLREQYQYAGNYKEFLEEMPERAEKLQTASVFVRPDSFSYRHILKSVQDYGCLGEVDIVVDYNQGILTLVRDKTPALFLLVILLFFAGSIYQEEADSGMLGLLTSNKNGRLPLALAKWVTLILIAVLTALVVALGRIVLAGEILGFGELSRSLQSVSYFRNCCYSLSVGGYLAISVLLWVLVMIFAGSLLSMIFWLLGNAGIAAGFYGVYLAGSYLAYRYIGDNSVWNIWKFINPFSFMDAGGRFSAYQNLNLFGYPFSVFLSGGIFITAAIAAMLAGYLHAFTRCRRLHFSFKRLRRKVRMKGSTSLWIHELYRLCVSNYGIAVLAVLAVWSYGNLETEELMLSEQEYLYYTYSQQLCGEITDQTDAWIAEETDNLNRLLEQIAGWTVQYYEGEMDEKNYTQKTYELEQLTNQKKAFEKVLSEYQQLKTAQEAGIPVHFISSIATDAIFGQTTQYIYEGMLLLLVCVFSLSGMFSADCQTGMIHLVRTTRRGRTSAFWIKYGVMLVLYTLGFVGYALSCWYNWIVKYEMYDWGAPLQSILQFTAVSGNISIIEFCAVWFVQMYLSGCAFVIFQAMLSGFCRKTSTTLILSAACIALDFLISGFSFPVLSWFALSSGFALPMLLAAAGKVWIVWAELAGSILIVVVLLYCHRYEYVHNK